MAQSINLRNPGSGDSGITITEGSAVADLTEDGGAIGGTNDGDIPDLTTPSAALNTAAVRELATTVNTLLASLREAGIISS
jgi:hypothetical protein